MKIILALVLIFSGYLAFAQSVSPQLLNGAAGYVEDNIGANKKLVKVDWTVGEPVIFISPNANLTQGFIQPENKKNQIIEGFTSLPLLTLDGVYSISSVKGGRSGNPVVFTSSDPSIVSVNGTILNSLKQGVVTITATQTGNINYFAAKPINIPATVSGFISRLSQTITGLPYNIVLSLGQQFTLNGIASSGLPVSYRWDTNQLSVSGTTFTGIVPGPTIITVTQEGNNEYKPAASVLISVVITAPGIFSTISGIIGKEIVTPGLITPFKQVLVGDGYTYSWQYVGGPVNFIGDSTKSVVQIRFPDDAKSGQLWNYVYDSNGNIVDFSIQNISVTSGLVSELVSQLKEVECNQLASDCRDNYINSFQLGKIKNLNSGCSSSGFGDFTATGKIDTLFMGESYDAALSSTGTGSDSYFAIWIDYNNNGSFEDAGDFIGSSFESDTAFKIPNLLVRNDPDFVGPRRLRVKMSTSKAIVASQSCEETKGQGGETEDYLLFIQQADRLKAPNVITPNNDGKNDLFIIRGVNSKKPRKLLIVDRWGTIKFEKDNYENDWDGTDSKGNKLPRGTYFFFFNNDPDFIQGFVEVINNE